MRTKTTKAGYTIRPDYRDVIVEGLVIANYKEFCELMNENTKTGTAKTAQLKEWERYFNYAKQGNSKSFVITDVYEMPLEKEDARGNDGIYAKHIEAIVLNIIKLADSKTMTYTKKEWLNLIGMYNEDFLRIQKEYSARTLWASENSIPLPQVDDFIQKTVKNLGDSFIQVLAKLKKEWLINYDDVVMYATTSDEFGGEMTETTFLEYEEYRKIVKRVLTKYDVKFEYELYRKYDKEKKKMVDVEEYWKVLNNEVEKKLGWRFHYRAIRLSSDNEQITQSLNTDEMKDTVKLLNSLCSEQSIKQAIKRHNENIDYTIRCNLEYEYLTLDGKIEKPYSIWDFNRVYKTKYFYGKDDYVGNVEKMATNLIIS